MNRSMSWPGFLIVSTASTTMSVSWSASFSCTLVRRLVLATHCSSSLSLDSAFSLNCSRNSRVAFFATSKPCKQQWLRQRDGLGACNPGSLGLKEW